MASKKSRTAGPDLEFDVTVELGRTKLTLRRLMNLSHGSLIDLPGAVVNPSTPYTVDVRANGARVLRGEVVAAGENYGVRVTENLTEK